MSLRSAGDSAYVREGKTRFIRKIAVKRKENMSTDGMCCKYKSSRRLLGKLGDERVVLYWFLCM